MSKPIYILGTGLSHDGSSCLLKDGKILVAIEKERINRRKHDGGNDLLTVQYCLDTAGITVADLALVVQAANFEKEIETGMYKGLRAFAGHDVNIVTISHHLAHAWSAVATSPFDSCGVLVVDGCGSPYLQCGDLQDCRTVKGLDDNISNYCEKDSFYEFDSEGLQPLFKDFAAIRYHEPGGAPLLPTIEHSIGGVYSAASEYCFGNMDDAGKLMGLAPYGKDKGRPPIFRLEDGRVFVDHTALKDQFVNPRQSYDQFKAGFEHYADIAWWVQQETARAVRYLVQQRMQLLPAGTPLALTGGVALNAVANASLLQQNIVNSLYMQPAAGDNGLALGCAYYGWMQILNNPKPAQQKSVFFGKEYAADSVTDAVAHYNSTSGKTVIATIPEDVAADAARALANGKIVGWFQGGAEFGPRALGHRSILADPRIENIQLRINRDVKNREDFRPFAPSVLKEFAGDYFVYAYDSPYMILTDQIKEQWRDQLKGVVHVDGSCRVQTVDADWNPLFHQLITAFSEITGIHVLLNTSFNTRGMPIVETPAEALDMFCNSAIDELYIGNYRIEKQ